jgi:hypothetical protein
MKKILLSFLIPFSVCCQEEDNYRIASIDLISGRQSLHQINQGFSSYTGMGGTADFYTMNNAVSAYSEEQIISRFSNFQFAVSISSEERLFSFKTGVRLDGRINNLFQFDNDNQWLIDTSYFYSYSQDAGIDSIVVIDSMVSNHVIFFSEVLNASLFAEGLLNLRLNRLNIQFGMGCGLARSLVNDLIRRDLASSSGPAQLPYLYRAGRRQRGKQVTTVQIYLPLNLSCRLRKTGYLSKTGIIGGFIVGNELQLVESAKPKGRFFWSYEFGFRFFL